MFPPLENEKLAIVGGMQHPLAKMKSVTFASLLGYPWILPPSGSPMRKVLEQEFRMQLAPLPKGLIETASILTTTNLIAETDMIGVVPQSIAGTYARHGLLRVFPRHIQHKMESFGYITRKNRPLSAVTRFFSFSASPALNPVALLLIAVCGRQYCARS